MTPALNDPSCPVSSRQPGNGKNPGGRAPAEKVQSQASRRPWAMDGYGLWDMDMINVTSDHRDLICLILPIPKVA